MRHPANHRPGTVVRSKTAARRLARMRTVEMLCTLLREDPRLRARWSLYAPASGRGIHQGALARVLAEHQWATGQEPRSATDLPRRLKDTVSRALSGKTLSRRALTLFTDAFEMDADTAQELWRSWNGTDEVLLMGGRQVTSPNATSSRSSWATSAMA